jgi:hypothetical protein
MVGVSPRKRVSVSIIKKNGFFASGEKDAREFANQFNSFLGKRFR